MSSTRRSPDSGKRSLEPDRPPAQEKDATGEVNKVVVLRDEHDAVRKKVKLEHESPTNTTAQSGEGEEGKLREKDSKELGDTKGDDTERDKARTSGLRWTARDAEAPITPAVGKGSNDRSGWGKLPKALLQRIISTAAITTPMDPAMIRRWSHEPRSLGLVHALKQRCWLASLRQLSIGWKDAVDDLSFWSTFYVNYDAKVLPLAPPERRHSNEVVESVYSIARRFWDRVCVLCHIRYPHRQLRATATPLSDWSAVKHLGYIPNCGRHHDTCHNCALEALPNEVWIRPASISATVTTLAVDDTDGDGERVDAGQATCADCRSDAVRYQLRRLLLRCARKGPVRGLNNDLFDNPDVSEYVRIGDDTAYLVASRTLETHYLQSAAGDMWKTLVSAACRLQELESIVRYLYLNGKGSERGDLAHERARLMFLLLPLHLPTEQEEAYRRDRLERHWEEEALLYGYPDEPEDTLEYDELDMKHRNLLHTGVSQHLAIQRVRNGIWVWPSNEVDLLAELSATPSISSSHAPGASQAELDGSIGDAILPIFAQLAQTSSHPFPSHPYPSTIAAPLNPFNREMNLACLPVPLSAASDPENPEQNGLRVRGKGVAFEPDVHAPDYATDQFLPATTTMRRLDDHFSVAMRRIIGPALKRIMRRIWEEKGSGMIVENVALDRELETWDAERILAELAKKEAWTTGLGAPAIGHIWDGQGRKRTKVGENNVVTRQQQSHAVNSGPAAGDRAAPATSPRVELVHDDNPSTFDAANYGITEDAEPVNAASPIAAPPASQFVPRPIQFVQAQETSSDPAAASPLPSGAPTPIASGMHTPSDSTADDPVPITPHTPSDPAAMALAAAQAQAQAQAQKQTKAENGDKVDGAGDGGMEVEVGRHAVARHAQSAAQPVHTSSGGQHPTGQQQGSAIDRLAAIATQAEAALAVPKTPSATIAGKVNGTGTFTPPAETRTDSPVLPRASQMPIGLPKVDAKRASAAPTSGKASEAGEGNDHTVYPDDKDTGLAVTQEDANGVSEEEEDELMSELDYETERSSMLAAEDTEGDGVRDAAWDDGEEMDELNEDHDNDSYHRDDEAEYDYDEEDELHEDGDGDSQRSANGEGKEQAPAQTKGKGEGGRDGKGNGKGKGKGVRSDAQEGSSMHLTPEDAKRYGSLICSIRDVPYIPTLSLRSMRAARDSVEILADKATATVQSQARAGQQQTGLDDAVNGTTRTAKPANTPAPIGDVPPVAVSGADNGDNANADADADIDKAAIESVLATDLILDIWSEVRSALRICECKICDRAMRRNSAIA